MCEEIIPAPRDADHSQIRRVQKVVAQDTRIKKVGGAKNDPGQVRLGNIALAHSVRPSSFCTSADSFLGQSGAVPQEDACGIAMDRVEPLDEGVTADHVTTREIVDETEFNADVRNRRVAQIKEIEEAAA